jgi:flagellar biosynthetic protein FliP
VPQDAIEQGLSLTMSGGVSAPVKVFLLLTALSFLPALLISVTSFARIVIVLSLLRQALGAPQLPPNPVLIGLSLFLTVFVMGGPLDEVYRTAIAPLLADQITFEGAMQAARDPLANFMLRQTRETDLILFYDISGLGAPQSVDDIPLRIIVPAFMVSELTTAFTIGLYIFIPLLLIDLLVSGVLMALGMMMVPPSMISLPVKLGVFVLADGWNLVIGTLARSFGGV